MIGSRGRPRMLRLLAQYADLSNALLLRGNSRPEDVGPLQAHLDAACEQVGRDPSSLGRTATVHWNTGNDAESIPAWVRSRYGPPLTGGPDEIAEVFRAFARVGISHLQLIVWPHTVAGFEACGPVLEALDRER